MISLASEENFVYVLPANLVCVLPSNFVDVLPANSISFCLRISSTFGLRSRYHPYPSLFTSIWNTVFSALRRCCRCRATGAYCHGDPHCRTFDGLSFDCHGDGDFLLLDSADEGAVVHARFAPLISPVASFTTGVAATEDGSSIIEVTVADGERIIRIDGEVYGGGDFPATMTGVTLTVTDQTVNMAFPSGLVVNAARWWTDPNYIGGVYVYAPIAMSTVGVLGTNNGDRADDWTVRTLPSRMSHPT